MIKPLIALTVAGLLASCASTYPCGEPTSGKCASVTDNYQRSYTNYTNPDDLDNPGMFGSSGGSSSSSKSEPVKMNFQKYSQLPADGAPLLSTPKMIRIWITPYTDNDNIYHDQSYEYVIVDRGRWNFSNNRMLSDDGGLKDVSAAQVSTTKEGYGSFGLASQPPKSAGPATPNIPGFPALNALQNQQQPTVTTTTVGSGVDRTTTITP